MMMQEVSETEAGIAGLRDCSLVAHTALAIVKGRQYAVVRSCTTLHLAYTTCHQQGALSYLLCPPGQYLMLF